MALRWWLLSHPCPSEVSLSSAFHSIFFPDGPKKKSCVVKCGRSCFAYSISRPHAISTSSIVVQAQTTKRSETTPQGPWQPTRVFWSTSRRICLYASWMLLYGLVVKVIISLSLNVYCLIFSRHRLLDSRAADTSEELQLRAKLLQQQTITLSSATELGYVQGMNVLVAPFLMVLPEMEAFFAFSKFIWRWCPLYVQPTLKGVHCGIKVMTLRPIVREESINQLYIQLVDMCLRALDPELYGYLLGRGLTASMYAFPCKPILFSYVRPMV